MKIKISELVEAATKAITGYGYNPQETKVILDVLMYAQLRGNNQGVVKLIGNGIPKREGAAEPSLVKETGVSALVDGNKTHAMVVMRKVTDLAIKKAKESGVGIAGNFNTDESTGALGYYVKRVADAGLIGFAFSSAPFQTTAPHGSNEANFVQILSLTEFRLNLIQ
ncbi:MAG: Ldh family oxidoreductase [Patescibacteria group bacterium]